jgi:prophage regulatory protein
METNNATQNESSSIRYLRLPQVKERTGKSASTIYAQIAAGKFPKPVKIGPNSSAWVEAEIDAYNRALFEASRDVK